MTDKMKILVATRNSGKVGELLELLADLPVELIDLHGFPNIIEPEETGATFSANAALKASYYARQTHCWSLADDSGLEVEALGGAPGVRSARYAGLGASDRERIGKLLGELENSANSNRRARFVCAVAVADETGAIKMTAEEFCGGSIAFEPRGDGGFGYDPIFIPEGFSRTFGELPGAIKQEISHRKRAVSEVIRQIRRFHANPT